MAVGGHEEQRHRLVQRGDVRQAAQRREQPGLGTPPAEQRREQQEPAGTKQRRRVHRAAEHLPPLRQPRGHDDEAQRQQGESPEHRPPRRVAAPQREPDARLAYPEHAEPRHRGAGRQQRRPLPAHPTDDCARAEQPDEEPALPPRRGVRQRRIAEAREHDPRHRGGDEAQRREGDQRGQRIVQRPADVGVGHGAIRVLPVHEGPEPEPDEVEIRLHRRLQAVRSVGQGGHQRARHDGDGGAMPRREDVLVRHRPQSHQIAATPAAPT